MNPKNIEKWLLLEQTGELSSRRRRILETCPEARPKREALNALCAAVPVSEADPSPWAAAQIAARLRKERRPVLGVYKLSRSVLGVAASLAVGIGLFKFHEKQPSSTPGTAAARTGVDVWNDPLEEELCRLETLMETLSGDPFEIMEM